MALWRRVYDPIQRTLDPWQIVWMLNVFMFMIWQLIHVN
jgi:hypothetical protein